MGARDTHNATVATATKTLVTTLTLNESVRQEACNASGCNIGTTLQGGNFAYVAAVKAANLAKLASDYAAEAARQASLAKARDTLRDSGDLGPF
jgi:hypothetical protein